MLFASSGSVSPSSNPFKALGTLLKNCVVGFFNVIFSILWWPFDIIFKPKSGESSSSVTKFYNFPSIPVKKPTPAPTAVSPALAAVDEKARKYAEDKLKEIDSLKAAAKAALENPEPGRWPPNITVPPKKVPKVKQSIKSLKEADLRGKR